MCQASSLVELGVGGEFWTERGGGGGHRAVCSMLLFRCLYLHCMYFFLFLYWYWLCTLSHLVLWSALQIEFSVLLLLSHMECAHCQSQHPISPFLFLQVHPDGLWRPPGPVSVRGERGRDLVSRQEAGCCPGATSGADAPHTLHSQMWSRTFPESSSVFMRHWHRTDLESVGHTSRWVNQDVHLFAEKTREVGRTFLYHGRRSVVRVKYIKPADRDGVSLGQLYRIIHWLI